MASYTATVEVASTETDDDATDRVIDALHGYSPAIAWPEGRMQVTVTLDAPTLGLAANGAITLVQNAAQKAALRVEALPTEEFDARTEATVTA